MNYFMANMLKVNDSKAFIEIGCNPLPVRVSAEYNEDL
jgi:hypothetical protein